MMQQAISTWLTTAKPEMDTQIENIKDWVETEVRTERMLAAKGHGVQGDKWYSLKALAYYLLR